ncbi:MAG TPA: GNAT family protein [Micavibrio sp.]|nr:GNAT family protein [Micavibrio sp.]
MMKSFEKIEIVTPRLLLRVPRMEEAAEVNAAMNEVWNELQRWMSWAHHGENSLEATLRYMETIPAQLAAGSLPLRGFCRENGRYVVSTGLHLKDDGIYDTGYWVAKGFLGKGYATEAATATMRFAFNELGAKAVTINHYEGNDKSRRIIERLGFTKTGVAEKSHARCLDGVLLDEHRYIMTKEQWRERCP